MFAELCPCIAHIAARYPKAFDVFFFCTSLLWIRSYICYHSQTDGPVWAKLPLLNWLTHLFFSSYAIDVSMTANTQVLAVAKNPPKKQLLTTALHSWHETFVCLSAVWVFQTCFAFTCSKSIISEVLRFLFIQLCKSRACCYLIFMLSQSYWSSAFLNVLSWALIFNMKTESLRENINRLGHHQAEIYTLVWICLGNDYWSIFT